MADFERLGDELAAELARHGGRHAADAGLAAVVAAWPAAVGEGIARNAWPSRIARDGTLHVATSSATWSFELTQLGEEIHAKLAAALGDGLAPRALRFAPGKVPAPGPAPVALRPPPPLRPTPQQAAAAEALASAVADPELRAAVARAARASLARRDAKAPDQNG